MKYRLRSGLGLLFAAGAVLLWGCDGGGGGGGGGAACAQDGEPCTGDGDCCGELVCGENGECEEAGGGGNAPRPAQTISLELIGVHDPVSGSYNGDCTSADCHGDRADEVALDGVTPTAHATMRTLFGEGNERCVACHQSDETGPDFVNASAGGLRKQVDVEECAACHGPDAAQAFYAE